MVEQLPVVGLIFLTTVGLIWVVANLFGSQIYDLRAYKRQRDIALHPKAARYRRRPLVSVVVLAQDDEAVVGQTLAGLRKLNYKKYEVIVVDNASRDKTLSIVKQTFKKYPVKSRLVTSRRAGDHLASACAAYKKYGKGELVMLLKAGSLPAEQAFNNAAVYFSEDKQLGRLSSKTMAADIPSLAALFQAYRYLLGQRSKKFESVTKSAVFFDWDGVIYRRRAWLNPPKTAKPLGQRYAADVVIYQQPPTSLYRLAGQTYQNYLARLQQVSQQRRMLPFTVLGGLALVLLPIMVTYLIYIAVKMHQPTLLLVGAVLVGMLLVFAVWDDEDLPFRQKIVYSLGVPVTYLLFYMLSFIPLLLTLGLALRDDAPRRAA